MLVYFYGKRENLRLMDNTFGLFKQQTENVVTEYDLAEKSTIGRTYLLELKPDANITNLRLHFTVLPRHLIVSRIGSILRKRSDYLLLEGDPNDKVVKRYQLEILPRREEKRIEALADMLGRMNIIEIGSRKFEQDFIIWVNDQEFFKSIFKKHDQIVKNIYFHKNQIVRISFYPLESPSIRLVIELTEGIRPKLLLDILNELTAAIITTGKKGYFAKTGLRIVKDTTLEADKEKVDDRYKI